MKKKVCRSLFVATFVAMVTTLVSAQKIETGFLNRTVTVSGSEYRYVVYVPREFSRAKSWPVIVALHGGGSYGSDGLMHTDGGFAKAVRLNPERFPAIVVFPQAKADGTPGWQREGGKAALAALDKTLLEFRGDAKRVYLTGLSAGGNGSWSLVSRYPERFAAAVIVCGFIFEFKGRTSSVPYPALAPKEAADPYAFIAAQVSRVPIQLFHGDADQSVTVEESRKMFAALKATGADVRYTEFPGVEHNAWDPAYARADLIEWMLKQRKK